MPSKKDHFVIQKIFCCLPSKIAASGILGLLLHNLREWDNLPYYITFFRDIVVSE